MKLRLILRKGIVDANAVCAEYEYKTTVIDVPDIEEWKAQGFVSFENYPEVIGGEWIKEESNGYT